MKSADQRLVAQQIQEMRAVQEKFYAMEQTHLALKRKYDILILRYDE